MDLKYNSTVIDWGDYYGEYSKNTDEYFSYVNVSREGIYPNFEDFNGDGLADMMTYPTKTPSSYYSSSDNAGFISGLLNVWQCFVF